MEAILKLLSDRIDAAHEAMERAMTEGLYGDGAKMGAIGLAALTGEPIAVAGIADSNYMRASGPDGILVNNRPREGWELSDRPALIKLLPKYDHRELSSFAMRFPAPRCIEFLNG